MSDLIAMKNLDVSSIEGLLNRAQEFIEQPYAYADRLKHQFVVNLFFENSTRTRFSFEVAEKKLGANVLNFKTSTSSMSKGETLYDTLKTIEAMGVGAAVIRHSQNGILFDLKERLNIKLINAGTGNEEHPTQALLDILTMKQEFGRDKRVKSGHHWGFTA